MPKNRELSETERLRILSLHNKGLSQVAISEKIKCSRCAVQTTIRRYNEDQSITSRPGRGRKRKTSSREDRWIEREAIKNRKKTPSQIAASVNSRLEVPISAQTVRRRLDEFGVKARKARKKPLLSELNKSKRLD